jgi:hypothetical protein
MSAPEAPATLGNPLLPRRGRRSVEMRAYGVRMNDEIVDMRVLDLCYDGCRVETETRLELGEEVRLSVLGRGGLKARVRWCDGRNAGLLFDMNVPKKIWPRRINRTPVTAEIFVRGLGKRGHRATAYDASPLGCKCEFLERPRIGDRVWVKFDGLEAIESKVCWLENSTMGLSFSRPIHPAVFELLLARVA